MKINKLLAIFVFCFISALLIEIQGAEQLEFNYVRILNREQERQEKVGWLRQEVPGDLVWQILDNFKILPENIEVKEIPYRQIVDILIFSEPKFLNKKIWLGIFHPDPFVRDSVGNNPICNIKGGLSSFWPMRLNRIQFNDSGEPKFTTISPHQLELFDFTRCYRDIPFLTDPREVKDKGFWSLIIDNEGFGSNQPGFYGSPRAFATFHRLVNN
jgi:hypothetical protein